MWKFARNLPLATLGSERVKNHYNLMLAHHTFITIFYFPFQAEYAQEVEEHNQSIRDATQPAAARAGALHAFPTTMVNTVH